MFYKKDLVYSRPSKNSFLFKAAFTVSLINLTACNVELDLNGTSSPITLSQSSVLVNEAQNETIGACSFTAPNPNTNSAGFEYKVIFPESINSTNFSSSDIQNEGSGGSSDLTWSVDSCGDDKVFKLTATNVVGDGSIIPKINDSKLSTLLPKTKASTTTNSSIVFDTVSPEATINQAVAESVGTCSFNATIDPSASSNIEYRVTFSETIDISTFTASDITNSGTGGATDLTWTISNCGDDTNFKITTATIDGYGTIIPSILGSALTDTAGNNNNASTAIDNSVEYITNAWRQEAYIKASNADVQDGFGGKVAINSDTVIVGVNAESSSQTTITNGSGSSSNNGSSYSGAVYVYKRSGSSWAQEAYIKSSNSESGDLFGVDVNLSGDTAVVSARREDSAQTNVTNGTGASSDNSSSDSGAAYIFKRSGVNWSQQAYLKASNGDDGDQFGRSVGISGDTVIVGADYERSSQITITNGAGASSDNTAALSGAAYIFKRTGSTWSQEAYLKASNTDIQDNFGVSVAISGDTAVVGAYFEDSDQITVTNGTSSSSDNSALSSGAAYVYKRSGSNWTQEAYLKASNTDAYDYFGNAVAISGDTIVIGAQWEDSAQTTITNGSSSSADNSETDSGAVYVYRRSGTNWTQEAYIKASNATSYNFYGRSVAISGDTIVVAAPGEDIGESTIINGTNSGTTGYANNSGAVYIYYRDNGVWSQEAYVKASNSDDSDGFGSSVDVSGDTVVVGSSGEDSNVTSITNGSTSSSNNSKDFSGAVYVYRSQARLFEIDEVTAIPSISTVSLSWNKSGGSAIGYLYTYQVGSTAPADCTVGFDSYMGDNNSDLIEGLSPSTTYSFRVCAYDGMDYTPGRTITVTTTTNAMDL